MSKNLTRDEMLANEFVERAKLKADYYATSRLMYFKADKLRDAYLAACQDKQAWIDTLQADLDQANGIIATNLAASDEAVKRLMEDNAKLRALLERWYDASTWADVNGLRIIEASEHMRDDLTQLEQDTTEALK